MAEALFGAMNHSAALAGGVPAIEAFTSSLRDSIHRLMVSGRGTRDLCGPDGLTTEAFVAAVAEDYAQARHAIRTAAL